MTFQKTSIYVHVDMYYTQRPDRPKKKHFVVPRQGIKAGFLTTAA